MEDELIGIEKIQEEDGTESLLFTFPTMTVKYVYNENLELNLEKAYEILFDALFERMNNTI
jgi:hypothetical protein